MKTKQFIVLVFQLFKSKVFAKSQGEPVENLCEGNKADPKAEATDTTKAGDEVKPGHLG